jgi:exodeoxyribonuclease VII large subunit
LTRLRDAVNRRDQRLDELRLRLDASMRRRLRTRQARFALLVDRLRSHGIAARIANMVRRFQTADRRLHRTMTQIIGLRQKRLDRASAGLHALSPVAVLSRGYALVYAADGKLLRSAAETAAGQTIRARFAHGTLEAEVTQISIEETDVTETNKL